MAGAGTATRARRSRHDLLGIYLNDHLEGATGGSCRDRLARVAVPAPAMNPPRRTLDVSSLSGSWDAAYASKGAPAHIHAACARCLPLADALPVLPHPGSGGVVV